MKSADALDVAGIRDQVEAMAKQKDHIQDLLDVLAVWYRDVLYFKATRSADSLVFRDQLQALRHAANVSSYEGIESVLRALETAKERLNANAGFELTMELLLLTMHDCTR